MTLCSMSDGYTVVVEEGFAGEEFEQIMAAPDALVNFCGGGGKKKKKGGGGGGKKKSMDPLGEPRRQTV